MQWDCGKVASHSHLAMRRNTQTTPFILTVIKGKKNTKGINEQRKGRCDGEFMVTDAKQMQKSCSAIRHSLALNVNMAGNFQIHMGDIWVSIDLSGFSRISSNRKNWAEINVYRAIRAHTPKGRDTKHLQKKTLNEV